jgi:hypothetical protein
MFQADELLLALRDAHVRFVVIGGIAVGVHGHVRATKDLDIVPDPKSENVARLSSLLRELEAVGPRLGSPHSGAVQGEAGQGLRESRPRAGRSRWRPIYRRVSLSTFVILAVAPEAQIDSRGFDAAVRRAVERFGQLELD